MQNIQIKTEDVLKSMGIKLQPRIDLEAIAKFKVMIE